jgi:hypothetical protein
MRLSQNHDLKYKIEQKIRELEQEYQYNQGLILTEGDLKCLVYDKLMNIPTITKYTRTINKNIFAGAIHTEISWYDKHDKLTIRPDITILEPDKLSIVNDRTTHLKYPYKGFIFNGSAVVFELKFIRNINGIQTTTLVGKNSITKDFEKIQGLFKRLDEQMASDSIFCFFIIFNKTDKKCRKFNDFFIENSISDRHKIIYATGKVNFK